MYIITFYNDSFIPEFTQPFHRNPDRGSILINTDKPPRFGKPAAYVVPMSRTAQRSIHMDAVRPDAKTFHALI